VRDGIQAAWARLPQILAWACVAATVGTLLRMVEERVQLIGRIVVAFLGLAWTVTTLLVVPVIAAEGLRPLDAARRSVTLLRNSWGENLTGKVSIGAVSFLLSLPGVALLVAAYLRAATSGIEAASGLFAAGVIYPSAFSIVLSTLTEIFVTGAYLYAAEGRVPTGFSEPLLREAFRKVPRS
jgi:hypothetical protein